MSTSPDLAARGPARAFRPDLGNTAIPRLHYLALFPEAEAALAADEVRVALRPYVRFTLSARRAARARQERQKVSWEAVALERVLRLEALDTLVLLASGAPEPADGEWPAPVRGRCAIDGAPALVLAGLGSRGLPAGARVLPSETGATRLSSGDWSAVWSGGDLEVERLPPPGPLVSDHGVRFRWNEKPRRGVWVSLLLPDDLDSERSVDPRAAFVEDGVRELRVEPVGRSVRVLGRRRHDYRVELPELPPAGSRLVLPVALGVLERQVHALHRLRDTPLVWHLGLLRLGCDPTRARWPWVVPDEPERWFLLTDPAVDGTGEQREWVRRALATPDLALLEGPPGSGKTHAIAELTLQLVVRGARVLLCSSANVAVDNVLERLVGRFPQVEALRVGHAERVSPPVRACSLDTRVEALLAAWAETPDGHGVPEAERRRAAVRLLLSSANLVCGTTTGVCGERAVAEHAALRPFDVLVIDEASRATFPEFLVPALLAERHVIVGDPRQLPPFTERADLEAALAEIADPQGARIAPEVQRACLIAARLGRKDACDLPWLVVEPAPVADALEAEIRTRGGIELVRVSRRVAGLGRVGLDALRAGAGDLALAAAGAVLVDAEVADLAAPWLPPHLEPLGPQPGTPWLRRVAALPSGAAQDRRGAAAWVRDDLAGRTWAAELAWRIDRVHQLERARGAGDRTRREGELRDLLPRAGARWVGDALAELRDVGVRSVIECVCEGRASGPSGSRSALAQGLPLDVRAERWVRLSFNHRMTSALSALPREQSYDRLALRDAGSLVGREARLGWDPPLLAALGPARRVWVDVRASDVREQARAEARALGELLHPLLAWMAAHPCRAGRPWEVACLSPYVNQEVLLRETLREVTGQRGHETRFSAPNVDLSCATIDRFQGREADVVVLALRNLDRAGHVDSPNRLNVAITRARFLMFLIGNRSRWASFRVEEIQLLVRETPLVSLGDLR